LKKCTKCLESKSLCEFSRDSWKKDGLSTQCKVCKHKVSRDHYLKNRKHILSYAKNYAEVNKDLISSRQKEYRLKNADKIKKDKRLYRENHRDHIASRDHGYYIQNKDRIVEYNRNYYKENSEKIKTHVYVRKKKRLKTDPLFRFSERIRGLVRNSIKGNGYQKKSKTQEILGCDFKTLQTHLEVSFIENYGILPDEYPDVEIHVDHIIPVSSAKTEEGIIELNHFTNLQLLFATDNLVKSDKIDFTIN